MNLWLLDASVLLAGEDPDDEHHRHARSLLAGHDPVATLDLAFYEVTNVAVRSWHDGPAAHRLRSRVAAIADDGGLVRADTALMERAAGIADGNGISAHDAAYVAAARMLDCRLVSCDVRDLVSRGLAVLPGEALTPPSDPSDGLPGRPSP